ncbi:NUMOD4 domain-containing protein [Rhodocaloribacter sp.]
MRKNRLHPSLTPVASAALQDPEGQPEQWKSIPGYEGFYEVSSIGRVRSLDRLHFSQNQYNTFLRRRRGQLKKPFFDKRGRARVCLYKEGVGRKWSVCHLVLLAFVGPAPGEIGLFDGQYSCNHKDGDCTNDYYKNLEWLTNEKHREHTVGNNLHASREKHNKAKLKWRHVREIRALHAAGEASYSLLAQRYGVSKSNIAMIVKHQTWIEDEGL